MTTTLDVATLRTLAEAADYMASESTTADRGGQCSAYLREAADKARAEMRRCPDCDDLTLALYDDGSSACGACIVADHFNRPRWVIATEKLATHVGDGAPTVFASRKEARAEANRLQDSTPSKYGRLIVRKL